MAFRFTQSEKGQIDQLLRDLGRCRQELEVSKMNNAFLATVLKNVADVLENCGKTIRGALSFVPQEVISQTEYGITWLVKDGAGYFLRMEEDGRIERSSETFASKKQALQAYWDGDIKWVPDCLRF